MAFPLALAFAIPAALSIASNLYDRNQQKKMAEEAEKKRRKTEAVYNLIRASGGQSVSPFGSPIEQIAPFAASDIANPVAGAMSGYMAYDQARQAKNIQLSQLGLDPNATDADIAKAAATVRSANAAKAKLVNAQLDTATDPMNRAIENLTKVASARKDLATAEYYGAKDPSEAQLYDALKVASSAYENTGSPEAYSTMQQILKRISMLKGSGVTTIGIGGSGPSVGGPVIGGYAPSSSR